MPKVFRNSVRQRAPANNTANNNNKARKKRISFDPRGNRVRLVNVPPRSQNNNFWFTEYQKVLRKGMQFEVEPNIDIDISIDLRVQLTAIAQSRAPPVASVGTSPSGEGSSPSHDRAYLEVQEVIPSLFGKPVKGKWLCVGSVGVGEMTRLRVVLPAGMYLVRCVGRRPVQVFAQAWDVERELK